MTNDTDSSSGPDDRKDASVLAKVSGAPLYVFKHRAIKEHVIATTMICVPGGPCLERRARIP